MATLQLGSPLQRYVRKAGMNFAFLEALSNNTPTAFTNVVTEVVDCITELTIKSRIFAAHFILNLSANPPSSLDPAIPRQQLLDSFNNYSRQYPHANTQATAFTNFVSKTFQHRATQYFKFRLRELSKTKPWYGIFGGPAPAPLASLSEFPQEYLPFLYRILHQLEDYNENQLKLADDNQIEVSRRWAHRFLKTLYTHMNSINRDSRFAAPNITEEHTNTILETIQDTKNQIDNSLHQEERFEIDGSIEDSPRSTSAARVNRLFTNCVRTDGYAVDFIFAKRTNVDELPDLQLEDFALDELRDTFRLWGLDPGQKSVFTAVDGHTNDSCEIRCFLTAKSYTFSVYQRTSRRIHDLRISPQHVQIKRAESNLVSSKTSRPNIFHNYLRVLLNFLFRESRFFNHIGKQKVEAELVKIFVNGGKKYSNAQTPARTPRRFVQNAKLLAYVNCGKRQAHFSQFLSATTVLTRPADRRFGKQKHAFYRYNYYPWPASS
ncbi:hypothetical protein [Parasitella parasitica]|uniref:Uncharacterized protein n=1 Tax=Parasitella parasitica TaxID=35722 RepID=A0A0B7NXT8_9FUNG|nr:hypothetical protein [Parasitella parasitica]